MLDPAYRAELKNWSRNFQDLRKVYRWGGDFNTPKQILFILKKNLL